MVFHSYEDDHYVSPRPPYQMFAVRFLKYDILNNLIARSVTVGF